ncbi:MAG: maltose alpha-D-glucosyltransferase [Chloroflexi bacterium]|nr:MAG: maltose alpha-D-glucosyltransferase [Chloroflexota bacterium]MBL1193770.1 maltose alpha-D-glucosyltransferase [Chloroflexota bacterium]NOH11063.1 maltose alpha-D-glucosyltransferase [Chloroflexota bacterium]
MLNNHLWYKDAVFYEVYVRAFYDSNGDGHGDLAGLTQKLDYIKDLGVDCIWLLPTYPSPLKDDGYDIADYYDVHPDFGTLEDFKTLIDAVHKRGMRIITDLVLNHTSDQHHWFQEARSDPASPYRDYYVWSDSQERYKEARIIFVDTEDSNWAWDEEAGQYYWHRFYSSQPDLNFDNPKVREEMFKALKFWLDMGIDGFRADAIPYLYEREGTNCENLPETHAFIKEVRAYMDEHHPECILLGEANQWPEDVRPYFADGDELHMNFHFPIMPRLYMALHQGDVSSIKEILARTPEIPENSQWCIFLRNHDELTLEMVEEDEREWMWQAYAPEERMRLNLGIRRRLAPLLSNDLSKLLLANSLLLTLPGSPIIYYGDEIGMGDNIWLEDRNGVRTPMQWDSSPNGGFSTALNGSLYAPLVDSKEYRPSVISVAMQQADPTSLLNRLKHMISVRKAHPAFGRGDFTWEASITNTSIAAYWRSYEGQQILVLQNLSKEDQLINLEMNHVKGNSLQDILTSQKLGLKKNDITITLSAFEYHWYLLDRGDY